MVRGFFPLHAAAMRVCHQELVRGCAALNFLRYLVDFRSEARFLVLVGLALKADRRVVLGRRASVLTQVLLVVDLAAGGVDLGVEHLLALFLVLNDFS